MVVDHGRAIAKIYLILVQAKQTQQTRLLVLTGSIANVPTEAPAYHSLESSFQKQQATTSLDILGEGIDLRDPTKSEYKVYPRSYETSSDHIGSALSLGGRIKPWSSGAIIDELWEQHTNPSAQWYMI